MEKHPSKELKKEIIEYCRQVMSKLNLKYLKDNDVYKNEFMEFLFLNCTESWQRTGNFKLTDEEISILFSVKKHNEMYMRQIKNKEFRVKAIDKFDNLILDKNEITNRTKNEGNED